MLALRPLPSPIGRASVPTILSNTHLTTMSQSAIGRNCRRPGHTSATQQVEQQRFCLVTLMMTEQQRIGCEVGKDLITRHSCGRLKAKTAFAVDFDGPNVASHTQACAVSDAEIRPAPGIRRKAVVHMNGIEALAEAEFDEDVREDDRVAAAGKADAQAPGAARPGSEKRGDPGREIT